MRVLLVEDEKKLSAAIIQMLRREHYTTDTAERGTAGLDCALSGIYDAVILDVMLPGLDGFTVLRELRQAGNHTPVLMLTALGEVEDRVRGLEAGADYYLPKPFEMKELLACLHTITRRREVVPVQEQSFGDIAFRAKEGTLCSTVTGKSVRLGAKEMIILELLLDNPGQILPKERMIEKAWGYDSDAEYNNLEVYLSFLRKKLAFVGSRVRIRAVRGVGYTLEDVP